MTDTTGTTDPTVRTALSSAVAEVLERMFFLEGLDETEEPPAEVETVTVRLAFDGDPAGRFRMRLACAAANAIAADFLGEVPESLNGRQSTDVILELANMICGAALSRIKSSATFRLGAPQIVAQIVAQIGAQIVADDTCRHVPEEEIEYTLETGSGTLTAAIQMETPTCPATKRYAY